VKSGPSGIGGGETQLVFTLAAFTTMRGQRRSPGSQTQWFELAWSITASALYVTAGNLGFPTNRALKVLLVKGSVVTSTDSAGVAVFSSYDGAGQQAATTPCKLYNRQKQTSFTLRSPKSVDFTVFPTGFKVVAASGPGYVCALRVLVVLKNLSVLPSLGFIRADAEENNTENSLVLPAL